MQLIAVVVERAPEVFDIQGDDYIRIRYQSAPAQRLIERVTRRQVAALIYDRNLQRFREFDELLHAALRAHHVPGDYHGIVRRHQELGSFRDRTRIPLRRGIERKLRYAQGNVLRNGRFLQSTIGHQYHGLPRRSHRDPVSAHGGFGEMRQRDGHVVPLGVIADHGRGILRAVVPLHARTSFHRINGVAEHDKYRCFARPGVVDAHRRVLQSHGAVRQHEHRLSFHR